MKVKRTKYWLIVNSVKLSIKTSNVTSTKYNNNKVNYKFMQRVMWLHYLSFSCDQIRSFCDSDMDDTYYS